MKNRLLLPSVLFASSALAQIQLVDGPNMGTQLNWRDTYSQGFDIAVPPSVDGRPWVNDVTLPGWYSNGTIISPFYLGLLSLGPDGGGGDRALGAVAAFHFNLHFALRLQNLSSATLSAFSLTFDGEQWIEYPNTPQVPASLRFSYQIFAPGDNSTALYAETPWTYVPELEFVSPQFDEPVGAWLDGNAPANRTADIHALVSGFTLLPGEELWLRWSSEDIPLLTRAHGLGIDNLRLSFVAIPEPASFAALLALAALTAASTRRRTAARCP